MLNSEKNVAGLWIGDSLPPLGELCIRSFQSHGYTFRLLSYGPITGVPDNVEFFDAETIVPWDQLFVHISGSVAPSADRLRYAYLALHGGLWTDMDVLCLRSIPIITNPMFGLEEAGLANLAVIYFPPEHPVMDAMARQMADPACDMPWDAPWESINKTEWKRKVPDQRQRRIHAEWSLGGPDGFTRALKHYGCFHLALPSAAFNPVHYTTWRWNFDGTIFDGHPLLENSFAVHLWSELLRREPDAMANAVPQSIVSQMMRRHDCQFTRGRAQSSSKCKIIVGICSCQKNLTKRQAHRDSRPPGKLKDIETYFFVGAQSPEFSTEPDDVIVVDAPDDYAHLPEKIRRFFEFCLQNYQFDWIFKCDDDTFVVYDRLHEILEPDKDIIGSQYLLERGSPSGGAGYFLSREMIERLVADTKLPNIGDEDVIHGEAVINYGGRMSATNRLRMGCDCLPTPFNNLISSHWCSIEMMLILGHIWRNAPEFKLRLIHTVWDDDIILYSNGVCVRSATGCGGYWRKHDTLLEINWFNWNSEQFIECIDNDASEEKNRHFFKLAHPTRLMEDGSQRLIHIGCGLNVLLGWVNLDLPDVDIRAPLPWDSGSVDALFLEHVIEHVSPSDAFRFMREAWRVLKGGGILRLSFPDVVRISKTATPAYIQFLVDNSWGDGSRGSPVESIIVNHGHLGVWCESSMKVVLESLGFEVAVATPGSSNVPYMNCLERHGDRIGHDFNLIETCCLEAIKLVVPAHSV